MLQTEVYLVIIICGRKTFIEQATPKSLILLQRPINTSNLAMKSRKGAVNSDCPSSSKNRENAMKIRLPNRTCKRPLNFVT